MKKLLLFTSVTLVWTLWLPPGSLIAADVKTYVLEKGIQYVQTDTGTPQVDSNNGVIFDATVKAMDSNLVASATLLLPNGVTAPLPQDASDEFKLKKKYNKQSTVDSNFPDGEYTLSINTVHDGAKMLLLPLVGSSYPNTPRISNYSATQAIDAGAYFLFSWDALAGGAANDFVQIHIDDNQGNKVWETPDTGEEGSLDGRASAVMVPARTFDAAQTYQAYLYFAKAVSQDRTNYPGAVGFSGYYKRTRLAIQTMASASQAGLKLYGISKSRHFQQTNADQAVVSALKPFNVEAFVDGSSSGSVTRASLVLPNTTVLDLFVQPDNKTFDFADSSTNQAELDSTYASGNYGFTLVTHLGPKTNVLDLAANAYPPPPHLPSLPAKVDPALDFVISWEPFAGGTSTDFVQLHIEDLQGNKVFETPDFGKAGALDGSALRATVPHGALSPGTAYDARVIFQKNLVLDTSGIPGALGVASYATRTSFVLTTAGTISQQAPVLTAFAGPAGSGLQLVIGGIAGQMMRLDASRDLQQWLPLSTNPVPSTGQIQTTQPLTLGNRYFRAALLP